MTLTLRDAQVSRDADDDAVLSCALAARADRVMSGDEDLLSLGSFNGIFIVPVAQAVTGFNPAAATSPTPRSG